MNEVVNTEIKELDTELVPESVVQEEGNEPEADQCEVPEDK